MSGIARERLGRWRYPPRLEPVTIREIVYLRQAPKVDGGDVMSCNPLGGTSMIVVVFRVHVNPQADLEELGVLTQKMGGLGDVVVLAATHGRGLAHVLSR